MAHDGSHKLAILPDFVWRHEAALELGCREDFWRNRHCKTIPVDLEGSWGLGPNVAGNGPKTDPNISGQIVFQYQNMDLSNKAACAGRDSAL